MERLKTAEEFLYPDNAYLKGVYDSASLLERNFGFNANWKLEPWPGGCKIVSSDGKLKALTSRDTRCSKNRIPVVRQT